MEEESIMLCGRRFTKETYEGYRQSVDPERQYGDLCQKILIALMVRERWVTTTELAEDLGLEHDKIQHNLISQGLFRLWKTHRIDKIARGVYAYLQPSTSLEDTPS